MNRDFKIQDRSWIDRGAHVGIFKHIGFYKKSITMNLKKIFFNAFRYSELKIFLVAIILQQF